MDALNSDHTFFSGIEARSTSLILIEFSGVFVSIVRLCRIGLGPHRGQIFPKQELFLRSTSESIADPEIYNVDWYLDINKYMRIKDMHFMTTSAPKMEADPKSTDPSHDDKGARQRCQAVARAARRSFSSRTKLLESYRSQVGTAVQLGLGAFVAIQW